MWSRIAMLISAAAVACFAGVASAGTIEVSRTALVNHPKETVWEAIGGFAAIADWHPAVVGLEMEGNGAVGSYRILTLPDGGTLRERLVAASDGDMCYTYVIESGVLPLSGYEATLCVVDARRTGQSIVRWSSSFDPAGVGDREARDLVGGIYEAGLESIKSKLNAAVNP